MKDMTGRLSCCVPGCGRTFRIERSETEVMCGKHWRQADRRLRLLITKVRRRARRRGWPHWLVEMHNRLWVKGRNQAIERAMGL